MKQTYSELLASSEWQEKRHKILVRDKFTCRHCGSYDRLEVHHTAYKFGDPPWCYPDHFLLTLCRPCHENEGLNGSKDAIAMLSQVGFKEDDFYELSMAIARNPAPFKNLLEVLRNG